MSHPTITQNGALLHVHRQSGRRGDTRRAWLNFKPASFRESDFPIS